MQDAVPDGAACADPPGASVADKADRLETLKSEFRKSRQQHDRLAKYGPDEMVELRAEARKEMRKSLSPDQQAAGADPRCCSAELPQPSRHALPEHAQAAGPRGTWSRSSG